MAGEIPEALMAGERQTCHADRTYVGSLLRERGGKSRERERDRCRERKRKKRER